MALFNLGTIVATGINSQANDSMFCIEWDVVAIANDEVENGSAIWINAGAEYGNGSKIWIGQTSVIFYTAMLVSIDVYDLFCVLHTIH